MGVLVSHPCDRKKSQEWGTGILWLKYLETHLRGECFPST
jgi:hypothetical protein